jgi:Ca-activated chloride channel family protein
MRMRQPGTFSPVRVALLIFLFFPGPPALRLAASPPPPQPPPAPAPPAAMSADQQRQAIRQLPDPYRKWLEEVEPLVTAGERAAFLRLTKDYQRDAFIQRFWEVRNRQHDARHNDFRDRYAARLALARSEYGDLHDDRARVLLKNGEPDEIVKPGCRSLLWPLEAWHYARHTADLLGEEFFVVFFQHWHAGPFRIWDPAYDGPRVLFADRAAGGEGRVDLAALLTDCRDGDVLLKILQTILANDHYFNALAAFDGTPPPPGREWVSTFASYSTDLPAAARLLPGTLALSFPGRRDNRTVVQGVLSVPASAAGAFAAGERRYHDFLLTGEILSGGALFESFRYKFDLPATAAAATATSPAVASAAAAAATVTSSAATTGPTLPLVFQRPLRPGLYTLIVKVEDLNSGRQLRIEQPLDVPPVEAVLPATPDPRRAAGPGEDPAGVRRVLAEANAALAAGEAVVKLVPPAGELLTGMARFDAQVSGTAIERVTFALDGKPLLSKKKPPYSVELDLGTAPRLHRLAATAYDAAGAPLAGDELLVNSAGHRFRIRLLEPQKGKKVERSLLARAEVEAPDGEAGVERVERVELYLGETLAATLYQPPYEQALVLPRLQAASYVRAVAYLEDGSSAEDLVFVNMPDVELVNVHYVELYASVLDRRGRPLGGLAPGRFSVREDGQRQDLVRCERVGDLPVHVAVLLDTSESMAASLDLARAAVQRFFTTAIKPRDRAALITFNDHPNLAVKFSHDQAALANGLAGLKAERGTALYDTLVYAFYYFNGIGGQRAILLATDGRDEDSRFSFEEVLESARRTGVAVYAIGLGEKVEKRKLTRLAEETGGRAFFLQDAGELAAIYATLEEELRSRYLLAYQSRNNGTDTAFRTVEVKVDAPGAEVKAPRGYYP